MKHVLEYNNFLLSNMKFDKISLNENMDIAITIPKTIKWEDYVKELKKVEDESEVMNFKVTNFPKKAKVGSKCYLIHDGECKGYMKINGFKEHSFTCTTTGNKFKGKFVQRTGKLQPLKKKLSMKGFRGFKYVNFDEYL